MHPCELCGKPLKPQDTYALTIQTPNGYRTQDVCQKCAFGEKDEKKD
jgi:RNase P subunit RPR2